MRALLALAALAVAAPSALALDYLPTHATWGATEATLIVRLPQGGTLRVLAEGADAAISPPGETPTEWRASPATFDVEAAPPEASWHGLSGTVAVHLRRADASRTIEVELRDASGGTQLAWDAQPDDAARKTPGAGLATLCVAGAAATLTRDAANGGRARAAASGDATSRRDDPCASSPSARSAARPR